MPYEKGIHYPCEGVRPVDLPLDTPVQWMGNERREWSDTTTAGRLNWGRKTNAPEDVVMFRVVDAPVPELSECDREMELFIIEEKVLPFQRDLIRRAWRQAWERGCDS